MTDKPEQMNKELGNIYNDFMNEAHGGNPGQYTAAERVQRVENLLKKGVLTKGIDLYHAASLIQDNGGAATDSDKIRLFEMYKKAWQLGYTAGNRAAALLYDAMLVSQGKKQRYGTHWSNEKDAQGNPLPKPLEDPAHVDQIRADELGLPPLAEDAASFKAMDDRIEELQRKNAARQQGN